MRLGQVFGIVFAVSTLSFAYMIFDDDTTVIASATSGYYGEGVTWNYDTVSKTLSIEGAGAMLDAADIEYVPWAAYASDILSLNISGNITHIGDYAFKGCDKVAGVSFGESLVSIGKNAFEGCTGLSGNLSLPGSLIEIGAEAFIYCSGISGSLIFGDDIVSVGSAAFLNCSGLKDSLRLGDSLRSIGKSAFYGCSGLGGNLYIGAGISSLDELYLEDARWENIEVSPDNKNYSSSHGLLLDKAGTTLIRCPLNMTGILSLPVTVKDIGEGAVKDCKLITGTLNLPEGLRSIRATAFTRCTGLTGQLTLPGTVGTIGFHAFKDCTGLSGELIVPESVNIMGEGAFSGCTGLSKLVLDTHSVIPNDFFKGCSGLSGSLSIPNGTTSIGAYAFAGCSGLTGVLHLGDKIEYVGECAFKDCYRFTAVIIESPKTPSMRTEALSLGNADHPVSAEIYSVYGTSLPKIYLGEHTTATYHNMNGLCKISVAPSIPDSGTCSGYGHYFVSDAARLEVDVNPGYYFVRWSDGETEPSRSVVVSESMDYVAVIRPLPEHRIIFDVDGGSEEVSPLMCIEELQVILPSYSGTKPIYRFMGWSDGIDFYYPWTKYKMGDSDVILKAVWVEKPSHKVTYNTRNGSEDPPVHADITEGLSFIVEAYSGTIPGYSFYGWTDGKVDYLPGDKYVVGTSDVVLSAIWVAVDEDAAPPQVELINRNTAAILAVVCFIISVALVYLIIRR